MTNEVYKSVPCDVWIQIDCIHSKNTSTGEVKLNITQDFKDALLEAIKSDFDFRDNLRNLLKD